MIDVNRFLAKLDTFNNKNDMKGARECIECWEKEARECKDDRGLLTVLNEAMGHYRQNQKKNKALSAMEECISLIEKLSLENTFSGATIYVNVATTLAFFDREEESLLIYDKAKKIFENENKTDTYEYATLLNNKAGALNTLKRYDDSEKNYLEAIDILKRIGNHDGEIAISLVMIAHITYDRDDNAYEKVENTLDEAVRYLQIASKHRDGNFAYVLRKCAGSFEYFKRPEQAKAMRDFANEIYYGN